MRRNATRLLVNREREDVGKCVRVSFSGCSVVVWGFGFTCLVKMHAHGHWCCNFLRFQWGKSGALTYFFDNHKKLRLCLDTICLGKQDSWAGNE